MIRIGIDARYLSHGIVGGINSYLRNLLPALFEGAKTDQIYLYADTKCPFELGDLPGNVQLRLVSFRSGLSSLYYDYNLFRTMTKDQLDVAHFPANRGFGPRGARTVITLHDEINIMPLWRIYYGHPKNIRTLAWMTYLHLHSSQSVRKADLLVTISEYAKKQIVRWGKLPENKVVVIHHGKPMNVNPVSDEETLRQVKEKFGITKAYVLADALKNPGVLVRAWKLLPEAIRKDREIIFFTRMENVRREVHEAVEAGYARLLLRPEREELNALYSMATLFIFPSWIEGFGLPLLEAMSCGAPILASDRGSIPEVLGEAGEIFGVEDHAKLAQLLEKYLLDSHAREQLREAGYQRVKTFTWAESARRLLAVYHELAGKG